MIEHVRVMSPRAIYLCLCAALPSVGFGQEPLSAIDWLSTPPPLPQEQIQKSKPSEPFTAAPALAPVVTASTLDWQDVNAAGLITAASAQLPQRLWTSPDPSQSADHIARIPLLKSSEGNLLLASLMMSETETAQEAPAQTEIFQARVEKLIEIGAVEAGYALIDLIQPASEPDLTRLALDIALLRGPAFEDCTRALEAKVLTDPQYIVQDIYCHVLLQKWEDAEILITGAEALDLISPLDLELLWQFIDPEYADTVQPPLLDISDLTPIRFRLIESLGATPFLNQAPIPYQWSYLNGHTGWKLQIEAAETLAHAGVVSGNVLLGFYTDRKPSASGGVWERAKAIQSLEAASLSNQEAAFAHAVSVFAQTQDLKLLALTVNAMDIATTAPFRTRPEWFHLMILSDPQTARDLKTQGLGDDLAFARALLRQDAAQAKDMRPASPLAHALLAALTQGPAPSSRPTGDEIALALFEIAKGETGDILALNSGLRRLRAAGLEEYAWRIAAQISVQSMS